MIKINNVAVNDTAILPLNDAHGEPLLTEGGQRVSVVIHGPGSKVHVAAKTAQQNRMVARVVSRRVDETAESKARADAEFLAAITASDSGLDFEGLTENLAGHAKYLAVYGHAPIGFINEQVTKFCGDWANFTPGSVKS